MDKFDLIVIGAGPAGYAAAMRAIDFGKTVCLIERKRIGGAGIHDGALSSKTLWEISNKVININDTIVNMGREAYEIGWKAVKKTVDEAKLERKLQYSLHMKLLQDNTTKQLLWLERGDASFVSKNEVKISHNEHEKIVVAENIIVATGSRPRKLKQFDIDEKNILTSNGIEHLEDFPKSLVIVGAGVIGCEYATIFSNFGKTKVYLIDRQERILPGEDEDISDLVAKNLEKRGVTIHHKATLERLEHIGNEVEYELSYPDRENEIIRVEKALLSIGRVPNIEFLNLEACGVTVLENGRIDEKDTKSKIPNIYAVGDVSGGVALVNMAEIEARHAVEKIYAGKVSPINEENICTIMFLQPEVALVGMNEQQCVAKNIPIKVVKMQYSLIARAIAMRKTQGFFKIIVTNDDEMRILGMRACGEHASSAIQAIGLLIKMGQPIEAVAELIHPHPSIVEGIQECVRVLLNRSIFKASVFRDKMACYTVVDGIKTNIETGIQCVM